MPKNNVAILHQNRGSLIAFGLGLLLLASTSAAAGETQQMPQVLDLNAQAQCREIEKLAKDRKEVPNFSHLKHADQYLLGNAEYATNTYTDAFTCTACHVSSATPEDILSADACSRLAGAMESQERAGDVKNYFHNICQQCHKNMKKAGKDTGPTSCKDCHSAK